MKPEDVPLRVPEMDELQPEQQAKISDLLSAVKEGNGGAYPFLFAREEDDPARRDLAYKFLKSRKWKLADAMTMVNNTLKFREEHNLDSWRLFPSAFPLLGYDEADIVRRLGTIPGAPVPLDGRPFPTEWDVCYRALQSSYVNVYHYWDKEGHPVLYDCCGQASVSGILSRLEKATKVGQTLRDVIVPYHTYMNEVQYYMIRYANMRAQEEQRKAKESGTVPADEPEKKIMGITVVLNAEGMHLGMIQRRFVRIVQDIFTVDQSYYPEVLHRLFVINCPSLIRTAFSLVKGSLDENTCKKIVFCGKSESLDVLRRVIDEDKIPQELGGGCRCEGGCLPRYKDPSEDENGGSAPANVVEVPTESATIKAGKKLMRDVPVKAGDRVSWQFALEKSDVMFTAAFEPCGAAGKSSRAAGSPKEPASSPLGDGEHGHLGSVQSSEKESMGESTRLNATNGGGALSHDDTPSDVPKKAVSNKSGSKSKDNGHAKSGKTPPVDGQCIIKAEKVNGDVDYFVAEEDGVVHLLWDNGSSWMTSKKIQYRVFNGQVEE